MSLVIDLKIKITILDPRYFQLPVTTKKVTQMSLEEFKQNTIRYSYFRCQRRLAAFLTTFYQKYVLFSLIILVIFCKRWKDLTLVLLDGAGEEFILIERAGIFEFKNVALEHKNDMTMRRLIVYRLVWEFLTVCLGKCSRKLALNFFKDITKLNWDIDIIYYSYTWWINLKERSKMNFIELHNWMKLLIFINKLHFTSPFNVPFNNWASAKALWW